MKRKLSLLFLCVTPTMAMSMFKSGIKIKKVRFNPQVTEDRTYPMSADELSKMRDHKRTTEETATNNKREHLDETGISVETNNENRKRNKRIRQIIVHCRNESNQKNPQFQQRNLFDAPSLRK